MARPLLVFVVGLALLALAFLSPGCKGTGGKAPAPRTDPAAALGEGRSKDDAISTEARAIVAAPADSALVSAAAARILDVLRLSPWAKTEATIKALLSERDAAQAAAADLTAQLDKANQRTDQLIRLGLAGLGALLIAGGVAIAIVAAKAGGIFIGLGPMQAGAIGAAGATLLFCSYAYGWALRNQGWVMGSFAACLVAAAAFWISNRRHAAA